MDLTNSRYPRAPPRGSKSLTLSRSDPTQLCLRSQEGCNTTQNWACPLRGQPGPTAKQHHFVSPPWHRAGPIRCREIPTPRSNHPPQSCSANRVPSASRHCFREAIQQTKRAIRQMLVTPGGHRRRRRHNKAACQQTLNCLQTLDPKC